MTIITPPLETGAGPAGDEAGSAPASSAPTPAPSPSAAATLSFVISADDMDAFRRLSGDENPLHYDADFAKARGFAAPVVFGGLLVAQVSRLLGNHLPGPGCVWHSLKMEFRAPLLVGEPAVVHGIVVHAGEVASKIQFQIHGVGGVGDSAPSLPTVAAGGAGRLIAKGEALAQVAIPRALP